MATVTENIGSSSFTRVRIDRSFVGYSTSKKPTRGLQASGSTVTESDLPQGATLLEIDTGRQFVFDGYEWQQLPADPVLERIDSLIAVGVEQKKALDQIVMLLAGGS
jgi:hypothetical protein